MTEPDDIALLRDFAAAQSESAFAALVSRHINLVYSTARRSVGNAHAAEQVTQAVFIILARKAKSMSRKTILSGWLRCGLRWKLVRNSNKAQNMSGPRRTKTSW